MKIERNTNTSRMLTLFLVMASLPAWPQAAKDANQRYRTKEGRAQVAQTLGSEARDAEQRPDELVARMQVKSGMTVADIGTGVGYMLPHLSKAVGASGKVLAEDIFPDFLAKARARAEENHLMNVGFIQGNERDPMLPANSLDVALILDAFHHFDYPAEMCATIRGALKNDGRLVIVEYHKSRFQGAQANHIRFTDKELTKEVEGYGFELVSSEDFNPGVQFISIFRKK
jgi:ubiquinone/menaquinone biosynthesis C-methylase UbiE